MVKLLIFDWDDVIVMGAKKGYIKCLHNTLVTLDVHLEPKDEEHRILQSWGKSHEEELKNLLKENLGLLPQAMHIYETMLFGKAFVGELTYREGTSKALRQLSKHYSLAVATGAHHELIELAMSTFHIPDVFKQIISSYDVDEVSKQKPHPYMLERIMHTQNRMPSETLFIGDAEIDVIMARQAHVEPVVVLTGHLNRTSAKKLHVRYIAEDVARLSALLDDKVD
jgi:HAD superfamily hydrolase (TIGR01549 family)